MKNTLLLLVLLVLISCGRNSSDNDEMSQNQLPSITQTGANTAGCIINGKVIIPKDGINPSSGFGVNGLVISTGINFYTPIYGDDYLSVSITNLIEKGQSYSVYVHLSKLTNGVGQYTVDQSNGEYNVYASRNPQIIVRETNDGVSGTTYLSGPNSGKINITTFNNTTCSGTFSATLYNKDDPSKTLQVTEGRFDVRIQ